MGQTNQSSYQENNDHSGCCLSRRYTIKSKIKKQTQNISKTKHPQIFQTNHHMPAHHQQPSPSNIHPKSNFNPYVSPSPEFILDPQSPNQEKHKIQQIGNLQLESHLLSKIENPQKPQESKNQKRQCVLLPDILQENERNSTRENSLSSKNFSHKNSISSNNHILRNKIKNLKFKYTIAEQPEQKDPPFSQPLPKINDLEEKLQSSKNEAQRSKIEVSHEKELKQKINEQMLKNVAIEIKELIENKMNESGKNQTFKNHQNEANDGIEFFSQDSDSVSETSSESGSQQSDQFEDKYYDMLSSQRIDIMVHQFNKNLRAEQRVGSLNDIEKYREALHRIQQTKSANQLSYWNKKWKQSPLAEKMSHEKSLQIEQKKYSKIAQKQQNQPKNEKENIQSKDFKTIAGSFEREVTPAEHLKINDAKMSTQTKSKVQMSSKVVQNSLSSRPQRSGKKIIAF